MSRHFGCVVVILGLLLCGCPAGGFFGRYLVVNSTDETISELDITTRASEEKWRSVKPGNASVRRPKSFGDMEITVRWKVDSGDEFNVKFSIKKAAGYRNTDDLYIELKPRGVLALRLVKRPEQEEISPDGAAQAN
jgi:hypothetical protein